MVDETTKTQQDEVKTPDGDEGTTPEETPETLKEQVKHIKEAALAEVGRYRVETERAVKAANAAGARLTQFIKDQEDAELEAARDNSEKLTSIRDRQARRRTESELATMKQELDEKTERLTQLDADKVEVTKERNAREIATRLNVNANRLVKLAKFTDGTSEAIEDIAKDLPKVGDAKTPLRLDSSKTTGGSASFERIRDDMIKNPSNDAKMRRYLDAKKVHEG